LEEPCIALSEAKPVDIPEIIPELLIRIRMIWDKCEYYQNKERICNLLKRVSNEIIKRCIASINVNDLFDGDVENC
jgi:dynein heavy chain